MDQHADLKFKVLVKSVQFQLDFKLSTTPVSFVTSVRGLTWYKLHTDSVQREVVRKMKTLKLTFMLP